MDIENFLAAKSVQSSSNVLDTLAERGYLAQCTNEEALREWLQTPGRFFYIGFDPTADSLHVGHFLQMMVMMHMQAAGHRPIVLIGGGTAMIGDPSGRSDLRQVLTPERIQHNASCFQKQMERMIDFSENQAVMLNNADWISDLNYIDFLREIGSSFSVNRMLTAECYKARLEKGLTFLEFNYMLLQAYDFYRLFQLQDCRVELGGDDQWSNILAGIDLVRRKEQSEVFGLTFKLLTTSEGVKMGKTAKGAVWLDKDKCSVFDFYQYWRNVNDADVINLMKLLTFTPMDEIRAIENLEGSELNKVKKDLAYKVTQIVHGTEEANAAQKQAEEIFEGAGRSENMETASIKKSGLNSLRVIDLMAEAKWIPSKSEARRLIKGGGIKLNDISITDADRTFLPEDFTETNEVIIRRGKKKFYRVLLED